MKKAVNTVNILSVPFPIRSKEETLSLIDLLLCERKNARIFTPNPEILYRARSSAELRRHLLDADLLLPDGIGIVLASRLTKTPLPCRITGIDTAEHILTAASDRGLSVYFLGGKAGVAQRASEELTKRYSGLRTAGCHHGYFSSENELTETVEAIKASAPDILFVCLGSPAQEKFIAKYTPSIPSLRLSMGLGGCLDVWAGNLKRAPRVMQKSGTEWLYRIIREPKRLKRLPYLAGFCTEAIRENLFSQKRE